ncbi:hypothetical protein [Tenacibaculum soleae]|uniref:hypothetical protein n=1 Tax=Tenacibaculum soleae TaxID=447689 RepID=UPI002301BC5C|nr:hypothetical protein [Tenacibaculum soleae]
MITFPYNTTDFAFTLSDDFIEFKSANNSYFEVSLLIKHYDFYSNDLIDGGGDYKIPLFNGVAKWYVGKIIDRYISPLKTTHQDGFQLNTTLVYFEIFEYDLETNEELSNETQGPIKFIPGPKPQLKENNIALLNINLAPCRVTSRGKCNVSFLLPPGEYSLKTSINDQEVNSVEVDASLLNSVYTHTLNLNNLNLKPADIVSFNIANTAVKKQYIVFPKANHSYTLQYVNSFKLISTFEFTGEYYFPDKYDQLKHTYKRGVEEITELIEVNTEPSLKINTGKILKSQVRLINELLKSSSVILENIENSNFQMIPVSKKRTGYDSKKFTYDYDIEFHINKKSDA